MLINPYTGQDVRNDPWYPDLSINQTGGNKMAISPLSYPDYLTYAKANPLATYDQMIAAYPGLTRDIIDLYSTQMRNNYNSQQPFANTINPGPMQQTAAWQNLIQQGYDPGAMLGLNSNSATLNNILTNDPRNNTPGVTSTNYNRGVGNITTPVNQGVRPPAGNISAGRAFGPTNTLNSVLQNRSGYIGKTIPENSSGYIGNRGTMLDQILRKRQSGYLR